MPPDTTCTPSVFIENVTSDSMKVNINGEVQEIKNGLEELKSLLQKMNAEHFKSGDKIYNIGSITNATFSAEIGKKTFNMLLCRRLIEAIQDYSPDAKCFLESIKDADKADWETQSRYTRKANSYIISSFVGVMGVLLRKLIASGQDASSNNKYKDYIEVCIAAVNRALQLLCYSFISSLWNQKKDRKFDLDKNTANYLDNFFNTSVELNISDYVQLFKALIKMFTDQNLDFPFKEIKDMADDLKEGSAFLTSCKNLQSISDKLDSGQYILSTAFEAETELTSFLSALKFLVNYKMVSIKDIVYEEVRTNQAKYLHSYTFLGIDSENNMYAEKFKYDSKPVSTDAILLFNDTYTKGLNLFPFIIDYNALTDEMEAKICFFTYFEENKKKLTYSDINKISTDKTLNPYDVNDSSVVVINFNEDIANEINAIKDSDITQFKSDAKKYHNMKLNVAYNTFKKAKEEILD